jgi:hypothetical protein
MCWLWLYPSVVNYGSFKYMWFMKPPINKDEKKRKKLSPLHSLYHILSILSIQNIIQLTSCVSLKSKTLGNSALPSIHTSRYTLRGCHCDKRRMLCKHYGEIILVVARLGTMLPHVLVNAVISTWLTVLCLCTLIELVAVLGAWLERWWICGADRLRICWTGTSSRGAFVYPNEYIDLINEQNPGSVW